MHNVNSWYNDPMGSYIILRIVILKVPYAWSISYQINLTIVSGAYKQKQAQMIYVYFSRQIFVINNTQSNYQ